MTTWLHRQRLEAVLAAVRAAGARTVLDLGCGEGALLSLMAHEPAIRHIVGIDVSAAALETLRARLGSVPAEIVRKIEIVHGSITETGRSFSGFDAALLVETIEHIDPDRLSEVEGAVFGHMRPKAVMITTPNRSYNWLLGVPPTRFRHADHRFEWGRAKFRAWAGGVARRNGYEASFEDVAGAHPDYGGASQMGIFRRAE